jgi:hypothetical protein
VTSRSAPTEEPQPPPNAPESSQSAREALPAWPPIAPLLSLFWQSVLFGSPDGLVSGSNATQALRLVSEKLAIPRVEAETIDPLRAGQLRKLFRDRFGYESAEQAMITLWRSAPVSPGAPTPNEDMSQLSPGPRGDSRNQPRWIGDLHDPNRVEREWLSDNGS